MHLSQMFEAWSTARCGRCTPGREPRAVGGRHERAMRAVKGSTTGRAGHLMTPRPRWPTWCCRRRPRVEAEGTVTSSERRVQGACASARTAGAGARRFCESCATCAGSRARLGQPTAEEIWANCALCVVWHKGMSYARLESAGGCTALPGRVAPGPVPPRSPLEGPGRGRLAPFSVVEHDPRWTGYRGVPIRLTTGRRLDSFNTGVQTAGTRPAAPRRIARPRAGGLERYGLEEGERVRVVSRRGSVEAPCVAHRPRPALAFMTLTSRMTLRRNC